MSKVLISGGTGLIGNSLQQHINTLGFDINILTRRPTAINEFYWDYETKQIDINCFKDVSHIIHLVGENIGNKKWTKQQKQLIIDSRVKTAQLLYDSIKANNIQIEQIISASGLGYYGNTTTVVDETAPVGNDFLAEVCKEWQAVIHQFANLGAKVTIARLGIVMSSKGGILPKLLTSTKFHLNAHFGNGNQSLSWIHIDDAVQIFTWLLQNNLEGIYNVCAPNAIDYKQLNNAIAKQLNISTLNIAIPKSILTLILGELTELFFTSNNCSPKKIIDTGFQFKYDTIEKCMANLLN